MRKYDEVKLTQIEIDAIKNIIDDFENDDQSVRERMIRDWKRLELMWNGFTNFYWDYIAHDWRIFGYPYSDGDDHQGANYDKSINVFRAYGETIIAALAATVPPIKALPDNVEDENDVLTARSGTKIAELCYNELNAPLLWVRILFTYYLQGLVASYNWADEDKKYGSVNLPKSEEQEVDGQQSICKNCGNVISQQETTDPIISQQQYKYDPGDEDIKLDDLLSDLPICPECMIQAEPEIVKSKIIVTRITGQTAQPKSKQKIEINGGLYVRVPNWARTQEECPYIFYDYECHFSTLYEDYPVLWEKFKDLSNAKLNSADGNQLYERWGRLNPQYRGEYPLNCPTLKQRWLRKSAFNSLEDKKLAVRLKEKFPDGCYAVCVNDEFLFACNENMDDHWTLMINPLSNSITFDALGQLEVAIQEITTNLISLELECIEHSVPVTFFNPKFVNSEQFRNTEVQPGGMYPTKTIGENRNITDGFHTIQTATVSPELAPFGAKVNEMGQFVLGALPQVWGGSSASSSRTASQYAMQRNGAQVRLSALTGRTVNIFWKTIWSKVVPAYMKCMLEDERVVKPFGQDSFEQTVIKKSETEGKIGSYYLEAPEGLPQSLDQVRDTLMEIMKSGNEQLISAIFTPENIPSLVKLYGIPDFQVVGQKDREKQYEEIRQLVQSGPIPSGQVDPMTGQMKEQPSVMPEFNVDNHQIEGEILRDYLVGEKGRQLKIENPDGYKNCLLHLQVHMDMLKQLMAPPMPMGQPQPNPDSGQSQAQPGAGNNNRQLRPVSKAS